MLRHDPGLNRCPRSEGVHCPLADCPGIHDPNVCRHHASLQAWRGLAGEVQFREIHAGDGQFVPSEAATEGKIRVGLWSHCLGLGGAEVWQLALARGVDPDRVAWMGAAVFDDRRYADSKMERELGSIMPVGYGLKAARTLAEACDVIVSWAVTDVSALRSGLDQPPSVIMACHFPGESPWGKGTDFLLRDVDRFVAVSELAVASTPSSIRDRLDVIWNAVDPDRLAVRRDRLAMRALWDVPGDALVAGYVGRLAPEKDPDAMLRLAAELPEPWHVVIVGEGKERAALVSKVEALDLGHVHLVGGDTAPGDVLGALDTLVVPSHYESFGLTLAEGLWAGVPVISTRSGLAKMVPGLVREVELDASGRDLAAAVLGDRRDETNTLSRVKMARSFARARLGLERFGEDWTRLIVLASERRKGGSSCSITSRVA